MMDRGYFYFDGKSSRDFGVSISGEGTYLSPRRDMETISIPGRNGDLTIDNGRYENIEITYPAFIVSEFRHNFDGFKAWLMSKNGYRKLEDTYHPDYYRLARPKNALEPNMRIFHMLGEFNIVFDCDPRRFLKTGTRAKEYGSKIYNPTSFDALPLIRAYGTGTFAIGGISVAISSADVYTDIDCEMQEAYKGNANCNNNIALNNGEFPKIAPGLNEITMSGITKLEITPRWWTI